MFIVVDRKDRNVRVEGLTTNEACWLGLKFARDNPDLVRTGRWLVVAFDTIEERYNQEETYTLSVDWCNAAMRVAEIIRNPPPLPPVHPCPDCRCGPDCCK